METTSLNLRLGKEQKQRWVKLAKDQGITLTKFVLDSVDKGAANKASIPKDVEESFLKIYRTENEDSLLAITDSVVSKVTGLLAFGKESDELSLTMDDCERILNLANAILSFLIDRDKY